MRWFLEEAADFLAKELRDWSQAKSVSRGDTVRRSEGQTFHDLRPLNGCSKYR